MSPKQPWHHTWIATISIVFCLLQGKVKRMESSNGHVDELYFAWIQHKKMFWSTRVVFLCRPSNYMLTPQYRVFIIFLIQLKLFSPFMTFFNFFSIPNEQIFVICFLLKRKVKFNWFKKEKKSGFSCYLKEKYF